MNWADLTEKKKFLDKYRPFSPDIVRNLDDWFRVELTYTSNAIEGNTLTRQETAVVLEKGLTVGGKPLKDHVEATNHAGALDYIRDLVRGAPNQLDESVILSIHDLVLRGVDDRNAGRYRDVPVRISGSTVVLPNPRKVPVLMATFIAWLADAGRLHPAALACEAHYRLVSIHPFVDGNGRTARLLMNLILLMHGYPPAIIQVTERLAYLNALETAQLGGPKDSFEQLIAAAIARSLDIYIDACRGGELVEVTPGRQLRIGELAKVSGESTSTIRFWLKEGLISVASVTPSGYQLFDDGAVTRCRRIQELKQSRLTLAEIKQRLV